MVNREVTNAALHDVLHIPGVGQIGPNLPPTNKTLPNFAMHRTPDGALELSWGAGILVYSYIIGAATVKGCLMKPEQKSPELVDAKPPKTS